MMLHVIVAGGLEHRLQIYVWAQNVVVGRNAQKYMAEISLKHCNGNARLTEKVFGWPRDAVNKGLKEKILVSCLPAYNQNNAAAKSGKIHLAAAKYIKKEAENQCQQDKSFTSNIANTRLTAVLRYRH